MIRTLTPEDIGGNKTSERSGSLTGRSTVGVFCCCDAQCQDGHRQTQEKLHGLKRRAVTVRTHDAGGPWQNITYISGMEEVTFLKSELLNFE